MTQQGPWPGRFVWHDLMTTDADAAERFYTSLFDWQIEHRQMPGCVYRMIQCGPGPTGGIMQEANIPVSHWMPYVAVENVDEAAARVTKNGGSLCVPPTDIPETGRFSVVTDPAGAYFSIYQGNPGSPGFDPNLPVPGRVCWNETYSNDADRSQAFYSEVFGWKPDSKDMGPMGFYHVQMKDGAQVGGLMQNPMPNTPSCWVVYFFAPDLVEKTQRAKELGAHAMMENMPIPNVGRFSMLTDPTGAVFALFQPDPSAVGECPA
ncbi:MAG: VOC family protein [Planctomycetota bacterium]